MYNKPCMNEEKVIWHQLYLGKLADVSTECSSRHQGKKEEVRTLLFIARHY